MPRLSALLKSTWYLLAGFCVIAGAGEECGRALDLDARIRDLAAFELHEIQRVELPSSVRVGLVEDYENKVRFVAEVAGVSAGEIRRRILEEKRSLVFSNVARPSRVNEELRREQTLLGLRYSYVREIGRHDGAIHSLAVTRDGTTAVSGSDDHTLRFWTTKTGRNFETVQHRSPVMAVAVDDRGYRALSGTSEGELRLTYYFLGENKVLREPDREYVVALGISADGRYGVQGIFNGGRVRLWDLDAQKTIPFAGDSFGLNQKVRISGDGSKIVAVVNFERSLRFWDRSTPYTLELTNAPGSRFSSVAIDSDGSRIVTVSAEGEVRGWHPKSETSYVLFAGTGTQLGEGLALSADGRRAVGVTDNGVVWILDVPTHRRIELPMNVGKNLLRHAIAIDGGGKRIVAADDKFRIHLWMETGSEE